jgi:hypothetical protein
MDAPGREAAGSPFIEQSVLDELNAVHHKVESLFTQRKAADASAVGGRAAGAGAAPPAQKLYEIKPAPRIHSSWARSQSHGPIAPALDGQFPAAAAAAATIASVARTSSGDEKLLQLAQLQINQMIRSKASELNARGALDHTSNTTRARALLMQSVLSEKGREALGKSLRRSLIRQQAHDDAAAEAGAAAATATASWIAPGEEESASARLERTLGKLTRQLDRAVPSAPQAAQQRAPSPHAQAQRHSISRARTLSHARRGDSRSSGMVASPVPPVFPPDAHPDRPASGRTLSSAVDASASAGAGAEAGRRHGRVSLPARAKTVGAGLTQTATGAPPAHPLHESAAESSTDSVGMGAGSATTLTVPPGRGACAQHEHGGFRDYQHPPGAQHHPSTEVKAVVITREEALTPRPHARQSAAASPPSPSRHTLGRAREAPGEASTVLSSGPASAGDGGGRSRGVLTATLSSEAKEAALSRARLLLEARAASAAASAAAAAAAVASTAPEAAGFALRAAEGTRPVVVASVPAGSGASLPAPPMSASALSTRLHALEAAAATGGAAPLPRRGSASDSTDGLAREEVLVAVGSEADAPLLFYPREFESAASVEQLLFFPSLPIAQPAVPPEPPAFLKPHQWPGPRRAASSGATELARAVWVQDMAALLGEMERAAIDEVLCPFDALLDSTKARLSRVDALFLPEGVEEAREAAESERSHDSESDISSEASSEDDGERTPARDGPTIPTNTVSTDPPALAGPARAALPAVERVELYRISAILQELELHLVGIRRKLAEGQPEWAEMLEVALADGALPTLAISLPLGAEESGAAAAAGGPLGEYPAAMQRAVLAEVQRFVQERQDRLGPHLRSSLQLQLGLPEGEQHASPAADGEGDDVERESKGQGAGERARGSTWHTALRRSQQQRLMHEARVAALSSELFEHLLDWRSGVIPSLPAAERDAVLELPPQVLIAIATALPGSTAELAALHRLPGMLSAEGAFGQRLLVEVAAFVRQHVDLRAARVRMAAKREAEAVAAEARAAELRAAEARVVEARAAEAARAKLSDEARQASGEQGGTDQTGGSAVGVHRAQPAPPGRSSASVADNSPGESAAGSIAEAGMAAPTSALAAIGGGSDPRADGGVGSGSPRAEPEQLSGRAEQPGAWPQLAEQQLDQRAWDEAAALDGGAESSARARSTLVAHLVAAGDQLAALPAFLSAWREDVLRTHAGAPARHGGTAGAAVGGDAARAGGVFAHNPSLLSLLAALDGRAFSALATALVSSPDDAAAQLMDLAHPERSRGSAVDGDAGSRPRVGPEGSAAAAELSAELQAEYASFLQTPERAQLRRAILSAQARGVSEGGAQIVGAAIEAALGAWRAHGGADAAGDDSKSAERAQGMSAAAAALAGAAHAPGRHYELPSNGAPSAPSSTTAAPTAAQPRDAMASGVERVAGARSSSKRRGKRSSASEKEAGAIANTEPAQQQQQQLPHERAASRAEADAAVDASAGKMGSHMSVVEKLQRLRTERAESLLEKATGGGSSTSASAAWQRRLGSGGASALAAMRAKRAAAGSHQGWSKMRGVAAIAGGSASATGELGAEGGEQPPPPLHRTLSALLALQAVGVSAEVIGRSDGDVERRERRREERALLRSLGHNLGSLDPLREDEAAEALELSAWELGDEAEDGAGDGTAKPGLETLAHSLDPGAASAHEAAPHEPGVQAASPLQPAAQTTAAPAAEVQQPAEAPVPAAQTPSPPAAAPAAETALAAEMAAAATAVLAEQQAAEKKRATARLAAAMPASSESLGGSNNAEAGRERKRRLSSSSDASAHWSRRGSLRVDQPAFEPAELPMAHVIRLNTIWAQLRMPVELRRSLLREHGLRLAKLLLHASHLESASDAGSEAQLPPGPVKTSRASMSSGELLDGLVTSWEQARICIDVREAALQELRGFERRASDPRRLMYGSQTALLAEEQVRGAHRKALRVASDALTELLDAQPAAIAVRGLLSFDGAPYESKMHTDVTAMLFELEQERLRERDEGQPGKSDLEARVLAEATGAFSGARATSPIKQHGFQLAAGFALPPANSPAFIRIPAAAPPVGPAPAMPSPRAASIARVAATAGESPRQAADRATISASADLARVSALVQQQLLSGIDLRERRR